MLRVLWHGGVILVLTILTQLGGIAWLAALALSRLRAGTFLALFLLIYGGFWVAARAYAPEAGRVAIPCTDPGPGRAVALSPLYCALNRIYVTPDAASLADRLAAHMEARFPGTRTRLLDAGFPFLDGFPLIPHLSHDDGRKFDLALWYQGGRARSPLGYFAFEEPRAGDPQPCDAASGAGLRWDLGWLQPAFPDVPLDEARTAEALRWLSDNLPPDGKIFLEPHLARRLGVEGRPNIRFQGCRAARHDDHIHVQIR